MRGETSEASGDKNKEKPKMRNGIISRSDGSQTYVVQLPRDPETGKTRQKWETIRGTRKDAERARREALSQIDRGQYTLASAKMKLGEFLDFFLDMVRSSDSSHRNYSNAFKAFRKILGNNLLLSDLRMDAIQRAVNELCGRIEKSTLKGYFIKLNAAMKYAIKAKYIINNPCDGVKVPKPETKEKNVWDDNQANRFIKFCKSTTLRLATLFVLCLKSGARVGEILALRWPDVDFETGTIHITRTQAGHGYRPPKSKNGIRKVPLDKGMMKMLSKHKTRQAKEKLLQGESYNPENLVFTGTKGRKVMYQTAYNAFEAYCRLAGLQYTTIHGLRHTHATFLLHHGQSVNLVAERLGDDPKTIMNTYAHVLPGMQAEAVRVIEQLYEQ